MRLRSRRAAFLVAVPLAACGGHAVNESSSGPGGTSGTPVGSGANSSGDAGHRTGGAGAAPRTDAGIGGAPNADDASAALPRGFPAPTRTLGSLSPSESKQFCREDARRSDPCILEGMQAHDPATCTARVAACRASLSTTEVGASCDAPADLSKCSVTVEQYFDCLDAWSRVYVCDNAGYEIDTPAACNAVRDCGLTDQGNQDFMQLGKAPSCDPNSPPRPPDTDDDIVGLDGCAPIPAKLVALGNSIAACVDKPGCAPEQLADYIRKQYAPSLAYENHAANASDLQDLMRQAAMVEAGPGHVAVWLYAFPSDPTSLALDTWKGQMNTLMNYFTDPGRFPDGATFMVNTQFNPSDECFLVGPAYASDPISPDEEKALKTINEQIFVELGTSRKDAVTIDEYPDFLGHASHADMRGCPYCSTDNTSWVADSVHPNEAGYDHIFEKWRVAVDEMYGGKCTR